ncbi:MAG: DUF1761 domain-containing protein [Acidimicrobiia bacterium]
MILDYFGDLNWLAVLVAALAYFVLGAIWYSNPLFGRQYRAALGVTGEAGTPDPMMFVVNLVGWFVAATVLGLIAKGIGASTFLDGVVLGLVAWVGFVVTNRVVAIYYEGSGWAIARVNGPYNLLGYVVMGVILAVWQ